MWSMSRQGYLFKLKSAHGEADYFAFWQSSLYPFGFKWLGDYNYSTASLDGQWTTIVITVAFT